MENVFNLLNKNKNLFRKIFIIVMSGVILFSAFKIVYSLWDYYSSRKSYSNISELYHNNKNNSNSTAKENTTPSDTTENAAPASNITSGSGAEQAEYTSPVYVINEKYTNLLEINQDTVGWLTIPGTKIDYPVTKYKDNKYYLTKNFEGKDSRTGSIFMDYRNSIKSIGRNTILYGHNMKDKSMFHDILYYVKGSFFKENNIITFNTLYNDYKWEVFSVYVTEANYNYLRYAFKDSLDYLNYLNEIQQKSLHKTDIRLTADDKILTLSTCSYEYKDARTVVHARLIKDTPAEASQTEDTKTNTINQTNLEKQ